MLKPVESVSSYPLSSIMAEKFEKLSPTEQKVAAFLLTEGTHYPDISLADLAAVSKVSPSAVVRMCQSLGFSGYRTFRLQWVKEAAGRCHLPTSGKHDLLSSVMTAIQQTAELLEPEAVMHVVKLIVAARQLLIYGSGGSGQVAELAMRAFSSAGQLAFSFSDSALRSVSRHMADSSTVILVISHRGWWPEVMERIREDKKRGRSW